MRESILTIWCVLILSVPVVGEDVAPPLYRGWPGSTTQEWDFLTPSPSEPYLPDGTSGITNNPYETAEIFGPIVGEYLPDTGPGPGGAWVLGDYILIDIATIDPGLGYPYPPKDVRIQVTFDNLGAPPGVFLVDHGVVFIQENVVPVPGYPDWSVLVTDYRNEWDEAHDVLVMIEPAGYPISEVVVDTIPEPATICFLMMGSLVLIRRRHIS